MTAWRIAVLVLPLLLGRWNDASAAEVLRARESAASAIFSSVAGCIETVVPLLALERVEREPPNPAQPSAELLIEISQFDRCSNSYLPSRFGRASGSDVTFEMDAKANAATVTATVTLVDEDGVASVVTVEASWTAVGPAVYDDFRSDIHQPGFLSSVRFSGSERPAAASATVREGSVNLTPDSGQFATLERFREASVTVGVFEQANADGRRRMPP